MWVKIDDKIHNHRKTRKAIASGRKRRDVAPMGLWLLAAAWAGQNLTDGWVPTDELDRWDDDWNDLADRLTAAGYWWPEARDGDDGYGFVNWHEYNPATGASDSGAFGNHQRWHVNRGIVAPECSLCPTEPVPDDAGSSGGIGGRIAPDSGGDIRPESGGRIGGESESIALPEPDPTRTEPEPNPVSCASADAADATRNAMRNDAEPDRFAEFWDIYDKKRDRKKAEQKWRLAIKKRGITADFLIAAAAKYVDNQRAVRKHPEFTKDPTTWLNGECWNDDLEAIAPRLVAVDANGMTAAERAWQEPAPRPAYLDEEF